MLIVGLSGCGTTAPSSDPAPSRAAQPQTGLLAPDAFAAEVAKSATVTINVHTPPEGQLPNTDLSIPFDRLDAEARQLPARSAELAIYCRTGRMSAVARRTLARLGYGHVVELQGGMLAWRASGHPLLKSGRVS